MNLEIQKIETEILKFFKDDACMIYVFGSMTDEKRFNSSSDIDIAIYLKELPRDFSYYEYIQEFNLKMDRNVDIIILNSADIIIVMQVIKNGKLLYFEDEKFTLTYQANKTSEYIEFKESRKLLETKLLEN